MVAQLGKFTKNNLIVYLRQVTFKVYKKIDDEKFSKRLRKSRKKELHVQKHLRLLKE